MSPLRRNLLLLALTVLVGLSWLQPVDQFALASSAEGLKRSLAAFAAARGLNAVISVIQGTEVTGGAFVNVTLALGQVLDPVNDLVEQFSRLMLVVSVVFSAQLLLMKIGATWVVSLVLSAVALAWAWLAFGPRREPAPPRWLGRLLLALLLVRFAVPAVAITSELGYQAFMTEQYQSGQQAVEASTRTLSGGSDAPTGTRWWELREKLAEKVDEIRAQSEQVVAHVIDLMVVFLMQTLVFPLLTLWLAWWGWRAWGPHP
ncbi:MAG: hypothetical protein K5880_05365 [Hydrogenophaga sp.]|uniref:hypothetical protein n=1 Tax=Hydrogenophaga sp. TaxID=1904254 RepID=UPI002630773F|nr:hypothetical protein [Hydrogenophaga sp.]MCV0438038.1 hypothetical protein [Hydrogenophaga sp.]